jgi:hypothetical protein
MKSLLVLLSLLISLSPCWAASLQEDIQKRLGKFTVIRGQFVQVKSVQGFKAPMRSSGSFLLAPEKGLLWSTERPFKSEMYLTLDKWVQSSEGVTTLTVETKQQPALRVMNQVMFRLLAGDMHVLEEDFQLKGAIDKARWQVSLYPKNPAVNKLLKQIVLKGGEYIDTIHIREASGDNTEIILTAQQPSTLTLLESQRFE